MDEDRGWVRPVSGDAGAAHMDPIEPTRDGPRRSWVGGLVLVVLIVAAVAAAVVWRGRNGDPFASARSIPATMDYVMTFDALALSDSERLQSFVDAFAVPMVDAGVIDSYPNDLVAAIDETMAEESGFTLTDDLLPWVGRSISIAGTVPEMDDPYGYDIDLSFVISADVRDEAAAEAFVAKVIGKVGEENVQVTAAEIGGQAGYLFVESAEAPAIALVLTDDSLLVGMEGDVAAAIEAKSAGLSMADDGEFVDTMSQLPEERMVAFYVAPSAFDSLLDLGAMGVPGGSIEPTQSLEGTAAATAISLVDEGLLVSYVVAGGEDYAAALLPDQSVVNSLPDDTLGFVSVAGAGSADDALIDQDALAELGYPLEALSQELGIDIGGLLESFSGDLTFAVAETRNSSIAAATDVPVGVVGAIGLTDSGTANELIAMLEGMFVPEGFAIDRDGALTTISGDGQELVSYSTQDDLFVIGTGSELVENIATRSPGGLVDSALYGELDDATIGDGLVMFVDIAGVVDLVPLTSDEAAVLSPLRGIGAGGAVTDDNTMLMEVLVLIDY
jgi:hypothetical protein